ncbi:MAG TPA: hypothetical protein VFW52_01875 [Candidatus Saccharimonadales bacterium]|nr:hypothetical protein [Candidatus Saccharimonadales bacterium]
MDSAKKQNNKVTKRFIKDNSWALAAAVLVVVLLAVSVIIYVVAISGSGSDQNAAGQQPPFAQRYQKAAANKNARFAILMPDYLPQDYDYSYASVETSGSAKSTYFWARYENDGLDTHFDVTAFHPQSNYNPPTDCGSPLAPPASSKTSQGTYPCVQVATIPTGNVYYSHSKENKKGFLPAEENYYTVVHGTLVTLNYITASNVMTRDQAIKLLASLKPATVADIVQLNTGG